MTVDEAIINIFLDITIGKEIKLTFLDLIAYLQKENKSISKEVLGSSAKCALTSFSGDLNEPLPAIVL
jgi:FKBP12-rapamycin complex-associated protein